ncbi:hypothetical protein KC887_10655 [Candidatus Kaiserbacteria bacterium]|nr:hypothetical protein [Candidatus Kaiserbacteria bacterium]
MADSNEKETLETIAQRQKKLETGQLILSTQFEQLIEELRALGGDNLPAKFRSNELYIKTTAERVRRTQKAGGFFGAGAIG